MTGRKMGKLLAEHEIFVKHLAIGWNEWRYFWTQWNHEHEWGNTKVEDYVECALKKDNSKKDDTKKGDNNKDDTTTVSDKEPPKCTC